MDERLVSMYRRFTWRILSNYGSPPVQGERIAAEYGGPVTTVIYPDGMHILNNLWYQAQPLVAGWLAETL
jgi:hypothetical protein